MASLAVLTLKEAIIPIVPSFNPEDLRTIKVENKWTSAGNDQYAKMYLPVCSDPSQKELFLYVINQFIDAAHPDRLHLTVGTTRYMKFRSVLDGDLRLTWQELSEARANKTIETFNEDLRTFVGIYLQPTSYEDQLEYMRTATKPFSMSCDALGARLRVISQLGQYLPGSYDGMNRRGLYVDMNALKRAYFVLMPSAWRVKFAESGHVLDGDYNYQNLVRFMSVQELVSKKKNATSQAGGKRRASGRGGGRGHSRGRGRGRMNNGGYRPRYGGSYGSYGSYNRGSGFAMTPASPVPYGNRTPGGRFPGRGIASPGRSGRSLGRGSGRSAGYSPSRNYMGPGQNPPLMPNFYTEHYMDDSGHPHHDSFVAEHGYDSYAPQEHYHVDDRAYAQRQEQYYHDGSSHGHATAEHGHGDVYHAEEGKHGSEDAHWLDEFGF